MSFFLHSPLPIFLLQTLLLSHVLTAGGILHHTSATYAPFYQPPETLQFDAELWAKVSEDIVDLENLPPGCSCVNDLQDAATCTAFTCHETCNLHRGQCDPLCCADPDCSADEVAVFRSLGRCLENGVTDALSSRRCVSTESLEQVNAKYSMEVVNDEALAQLGILCVVVDNNPVEGDFFAAVKPYVNVPELLDASDTQAQLGSRFDGTASTRRSISANSFYQVGDALPSAFATSTNGIVAYGLAFGGFLVLPTSGPDGRCVAENFVRFGVEEVDGFCTEPVADLENTCATTSSPLTLGYYLNDLVVGVNPQAKASSGLNTDWQTVEVGDVFYRDLSSGREVERAAVGFLTGTPTVEPTVEPTSLPTASPSVTSGNNSTRILLNTNLATRWDATRQVCADVVVGQRYRIYHDEQGLINQVLVDLYLTNISLASTPADAAVAQKHEATFINTNPGNESSVERMTSGNPGYITGRPIQSGKLVSEQGETKVAIAYNFDGLQVVGPVGSQGACTKGGEWWNEFAGSHELLPGFHVLFGVDTVSSCTVELTYSQFVGMQQQWCEDFSQSDLFNLSDTHIGVYGNADPLKAEQWIPIEWDFSGLSTVQFSPSSGDLTCQNFVSTLKLEVLWTNTGEVRNPQPVILTARASFEQTDWTWAGSPDLTSSATQKFVISRVVSFAEHVSDDTVSYKPDDPPLLPAIPSDVFYPFDLPFSAAPQMKANLVAMLMLALFLSPWN